MKKLNKILIIIMILGAVYYSYPLLEDKNMYGVLVKMTIIITVFIPKIVNKIFKVEIPKTLEFSYLIFIFLGHFLGSIVDLYHKVYWYDTFVHFLSGILVSMLATFIVNKKIKSDFIFIIFVLSFSTFIALDWEIFEFMSDKLFNADAQNVIKTGVTDTMQDMIVALLASLLYVISYLYEKCNKLKGIVIKYIESIK